MLEKKQRELHILLGKFLLFSAVDSVTKDRQKQSNHFLLTFIKEFFILIYATNTQPFVHVARTNKKIESIFKPIKKRD